MTVSHSFGEPELLKHVIRWLPLHHDGVRALNRIVLLALLIESDFTDYASPKLGHHLGNAFENVVTRPLGIVNYRFAYHLSSLLLALGEGNDVLSIACLARIDEAKLLHRKHQCTVLHQMHAEVILQHKKLFLKRVLGLHSVLVLNSLFPHTHELPALEFFEKRKLLNVVV